ncbi:MAG: ABC transporter permease [Gemmatimonadota bacterium]
MRSGITRGGEVLRALFFVAGAIAAGLLILGAGLHAAGYDAAAALQALWRGAFGSWYAITSGTLVRAIPLIIIGSGIAIAFRGGALNIGAEGQFCAGAIAATWVGLHVGGLPGWLAIGVVLLASTGAGALWIAVPVWLRLQFGVLEVITTLLLNFVAEALVSLMVQGPLQEARGFYPQSDPIAESARLPFLPGTRMHAGFLLAILLAASLAFLASRTLWGFKLRAAGANPRAALVSGRIQVPRMVATALMISGMLGGLAGGVEISGVSLALFQNLSPGYGFTAIAVALLARLQPLAVIGTGILFAALETGAGAMQRDAGIPSVTVYLVEAVIIIVVLLVDVFSRRHRNVMVPDSPAAG